MSILDSIKGERKLSFDHWRYRLLHWCFNVKNPNPNDLYNTGMPKFLYTHYCPLFHLTNLIALLSPLVLFIKVMGVIIKAVLHATASIDWSRLAVLFSWIKLPSTNFDYPPKYVIPTADEERLGAVHFCRDWSGTDLNFEFFWTVYCGNFKTLTKEEVKVVFDEFMPKVLDARERAKKRKDKMRERLIFWSNFSRVFIKWGLNIFYVALTGLVLYLTYLALSPVWYMICWAANGLYWLFTDEGSLEFAIMFAKGLMWFTLGCGAVYILAKVGWIQRFGSVCCQGFAKLTPPFYLIGHLFAWIIGGFKSFCEFAAMFYEENCPPIKLVSKEEEVIEKIAEKETT